MPSLVFLCTPVFRKKNSSICCPEFSAVVRMSLSLVPSLGDATTAGLLRTDVNATFKIKKKVTVNISTVVLKCCPEFPVSFFYPVAD